MTDQDDKFTNDYNAKWAHTERDWTCVGHDTSNEFTNVDDHKDDDND